MGRRESGTVMISFIHTFEGFGHEDVKVYWQYPAEKAPSVDDLVEGFGKFLRACGYNLDGLELVLLPRHPAPEGEDGQ